jgi:hypothetical protein
MLVVAIVPTYLAAAILGTLTGNWNMPLLLIAPWVMVIVAVPVLGLTTLMTAWRRSGKGGLVFTAAIVAVYMIVRQMVIVPLHLQLPTLFAGPVLWLMKNNQAHASAFPWGPLGRAIFLAAALPLATQYVLKRAEV